MADDNIFSDERDALINKTKRYNEEMGYIKPDKRVAAGTPTAGYEPKRVAAGTPTAGYEPKRVAAGTPTAGYEPKTVTKASDKSRLAGKSATRIAFEKEFAKQRASGAKIFSFRGKQYTTKLK